MIRVVLDPVATGMGVDLLIHIETVPYLVGDELPGNTQLLH